MPSQVLSAAAARRARRFEATPDAGLRYDSPREHRLFNKGFAGSSSRGRRAVGRRAWAWTQSPAAASSPESLLIGGRVADHPDRVRKVNPITYVTKDDPPFLIVHGDSDMTVPKNQSQLLHEALKKAGADSTLYLVKGGGHGGFRDPKVPELVRGFFDKHLKGRAKDSTGAGGK
jgi:acetyl esterase/lipase